MSFLSPFDYIARDKALILSYFGYHTPQWVSVTTLRSQVIFLFAVGGREDCHIKNDL